MQYTPFSTSSLYFQNDKKKKKIKKKKLKTEKEKEDKNNISVEKWEPTQKEGRAAWCLVVCPSHAQNGRRYQISLAHWTQTLDTLSTPFFSLLFFFFFFFFKKKKPYFVFSYKFFWNFEIFQEKQNDINDTNKLEVIESFPSSFTIVFRILLSDVVWCSGKIRDTITVGKKG